MDQAVIEQKANEMLGGAEVKVSTWQDHVNSGYDIEIVPKLDHGKRFIRVKSSEGMPKVMEYLHRVQQNLLKLQQSGALGISIPTQQFSQEEVDKAVTKISSFLANGSPDESEIELPIKKKPQVYECENCGKKINYPGIFAIHKKKCLEKKK